MHIRNKKLDVSDIYKISEISKDNSEYLINFYKYFFTDLWDNIQKVEGHPAITENTFNVICDFIPDSSNVNDFMLQWLDNGFATINNKPDFWIYKHNVKLILKQ